MSYIGDAFVAEGQLFTGDDYSYGVYMYKFTAEFKYGFTVSTCSIFLQSSSTIKAMLHMKGCYKYSLLVLEASTCV